MRILIAEDDPKLLKSLVHIFEMNHYAVDGTDAYDLASSDVAALCDERYELTRLSGKGKKK